jgi:hypothetical protein
MTTFDEAAIARAAQVLAGRVSTGRADWAACAVAVLDAAHQAVDPQVELTVLYTLTCAGCGSDWAAGVDGLGARTEAELLTAASEFFQFRRHTDGMLYCETCLARLTCLSSGHAWGTWYRTSWRAEALRGCARCGQVQTRPVVDVNLP